MEGRRLLISYKGQLYPLDVDESTTLKDVGRLLAVQTGAAAETIKLISGMKAAIRPEEAAGLTLKDAGSDICYDESSVYLTYSFLHFFF